MPKIGFAGLSHLGIVSSFCIASKGNDVTCYDHDSQLVSNLKNGQLPYFEPGLEELLKESRSRITFSDDLKSLSDCEVVYIARDVPTDNQNKSNLEPIRALFDEVLPVLKRGSTIVIHSQVPPGFTRSLKAQSDVKGVLLYYQVETLIFGQAVERALHPERYILGCSDPKVALPPAYAALLTSYDCPLLPMLYESAELAKISINLFLISSVVTTNTIAELCEEIGAEWKEIAPALKLDKRIGQHAYLAPGLGIAGGNLERDVVTFKNLSIEHGTSSELLDTWTLSLQYRSNWALRTLHTEVFSQIDQPRIAIWGIAYKANTNSVKNSPSKALIEKLSDCKLQVYDPEASLGELASANVVQKKSALEACSGADCLVVMTPWKEFETISPHQIESSMKGSTIIDPFSVLKFDHMKVPGLKYFTLGSGAKVRV